MRRVGPAIVVVIWLVILAIPDTRLLLCAQARGSAVKGAPIVPFVPAWLVGREEFRSKQLAARFPDDVRVLAVVAERLTPREATRALDVAIARFPNEPWLMAKRLRQTASWLEDDRVAGELEKGEPLHRLTATLDELAAAISVAERGGKLEPENCYFDWMVAWLLFAAHRDREALAALHTGAGKPRYDGHFREEIEARMHAFSRWRPLLLEERRMDNMSDSPFSELAKWRHTARLAVWEAAQAENAGDHARALEIYAGLGQLGARLREGSYIIIEALVAIAIEIIARGGVGTQRQLSDVERAALQKLPDRGDRFARLYATRFSDYARAHGRADLAERSQRESETALKTRAATNKFINSRTLFGVPQMQFTVVLGPMLVAGSLLPALLATTIAWLLMSVLTRDSPEDAENVGWGWCLFAAFCAGAAHAVTTGLVMYELELGRVVAYYGEVARSAGLEASIALSSLVPILIAALICGLVTRWRKRHVFRPLPPVRIFRTDAIRVVSLIGGALCAFGSLWMWLQVFTTANSHRTLVLPVTLLLLPLIVWLVMWRWGLPERLPGEVTVEELKDGRHARAERLSPRRAAMWGLVWYRKSLGGFVALVSLVYLAFMLGSLPSRHAADAQLDVTIQRGEMGLVMGKVK